MKGAFIIGTAILTYDEDGKPLSSEFSPAILKVEPDQLRDALSHIDKPTGAEQIRSRAETIMATWFNHVESVELADREDGEITSRVLECKEWPNGHPQLCAIEFSWTPRK